MLAKPTFKVCRRLGAGVYDKCQTQKFTLSEARHAKHAKRSRKQLSDFGKQLIEKQRVRFAYGIMERQLRRYVEEAFRVRTLGRDPIARMVEELELRLDNVVYRAGFARSRRAARQLVAHGHVVVNGVRTTIPSHTLKVGDTFALREATKNKPVLALIEATFAEASAPLWLTMDGKSLSGKVTALPTPEETELPGSVSAVLEYYSR